MAGNMEEMTEEQPDPSGESFQAPECHRLSELLPAYKFTSLIACGGMGAVYKAEQLSLGRDVAIKVLPPELSKYTEFEKGFKVEARAMAQLAHLNLIGVYDFGEVAGMLYLVMEFINGESLYEATHGQVIDPIQAAEIVAGVAGGLGHAHAHEIVHRDIKPANILLSQKLDPKLGDFGLAVPADDVGAGLNMGTPGYVAPEILEDFESASPASDVFSLGMIFHELLTGINPTGEEPANMELVPNLRGLRLLVAKAISPDPPKRHANGEVFARDLENWIEAAKNVSSPVLTRTSPVPNLTPPVRNWSTAPVSTEPGRKGIGMTVLGIVALLGLAAVSFVFLRGKDKGPEPLGDNPPETPILDPRPVPIPPKSTPEETFDLATHQDEMREALRAASARVIKDRQANLAAFLQEVRGKDEWKAYLALIDHERGLLPRFLAESDKMAFDEDMVELLNQYAIDHQGQLDYRLTNAVGELHGASVATLRKGKALPTAISSSSSAWMEWLGLSPFEIFVRKPRGDWDLRIGPAVDRGAILRIDLGSTVEISHDAEKSTGQLSLSSDGEVTIVRAGDTGTWTLRWRDLWLEGIDETGQRVRFRRKPFRFTASRAATARTPSPTPVPIPIPTPSPHPPDPDKPIESPLTDAKLANMRLLFRDKLKVDLSSWFKFYQERLAKNLKQAESLKNLAVSAQIAVEMARIQNLDWQRGYLTPDEISSENALPSRLADAKKKSLQPTSP